MLAIRNGDYVPDGTGLRRVRGREALLERVLWRLGRVGAAGRQTAAEQYVAEALAEEKGLTVEAVTLTQESGAAYLTVELTYQGEALSVTLEVR